VDFLPVFLDLRGRRVLLVGGGRVALRKAEIIVRCGARFDVVAPEVHPALHALAQANGGSVRLAPFAAADLEGATLVFSATGIGAVDRELRDHARARGIPVNVADTPELCDFILPAIVDRSPVIAAFSTGGNAPLLARRLRADLEARLPAGLGRLATFLGRQRARLSERVTEGSLRLRTWERLLDGPVAERVLAGDEDAAQRLLEQELSGAPAAGEVFLVGAGPGDPELLTLRALRLMQCADVVLYDRLVSAAVLDLVRRDAERIYVGKRPRCHTVPQEELNRMLVRFAREGKRVLRLKGGDPFVFGRGGEEIEQLAAAGIPFQVVPGITAANGCAAYAGIPLTHRDHAQSVRFVTGHLRDGTVDLDWPTLVRGGETLVFYMGLTGLPVICRELVAHGMDPSTPVALIEQGTLPRQRVLVSTLAGMPAELAGAEVHGPTLGIVGTVVNLRAQLQWFHPASTS
jgi:uroporphyrin-III C-methyltransferase/precorrin-2 dehydrogenase/sirohydrochlorin ferrochelatase